MKILLTGASGLLGAAFAEFAAAHGHFVAGVTNGYRGPVPGLRQQGTIDLAEPQRIRAVLTALAPDAIVNCAAASSLAECDADPARSHRLNVELPAELARFAQENSARFVHVSSEQVFDGTSTAPYAPADPPSPINTYGRQKVESEWAVHRLAPGQAVTVRPPLLLGNSLSRSRALHEQVLAGWMKGAVPRVFDDEFRQPCTVNNLAAVLLELCVRPDTVGIFHWAGTELVSRYDLLVRLRTHFQLPATAAPVTPHPRANLPEVARHRPACLAQDVSALASRIATRPESLDDQFKVLQVPPACADWHRAHAISA